MIGTMKVLAVIGSVAAASAVAAQPARADRFSFGVGFNVRPAYRSYYAPRAYYSPAYVRPYYAARSSAAPG
jgi:hypothetical protein